MQDSNLQGLAPAAFRKQCLTIRLILLNLSYKSIFLVQLAK